MYSMIKKFFYKIGLCIAVVIMGIAVFISCSIDALAWVLLKLKTLFHFLTVDPLVWLAEKLSLGEAVIILEQLTCRHHKYPIRGIYYKSDPNVMQGIRCGSCGKKLDPDKYDTDTDTIIVDLNK